MTPDSVPGLPSSPGPSGARKRASGRLALTIRTAGPPIWVQV